MFALLRHVGHASRYEIPPRPTALRQHLDADPAALQGTSPKRGPMFRALPTP